MQEQDAGAATKAGQEKKGYVGIHATGFKELMLKPELLQAITDCGFEHPSEGAGPGPPAPWRGPQAARQPMRRLRGLRCAPCGPMRARPAPARPPPAALPHACPAVQHECIPHAILGMDVLCQAKSGMGKTAVFVLSVLQQLDPKPGEVSAIVLCHTRELAYQVRGHGGAAPGRKARGGVAPTSRLSCLLPHHAHHATATPHATQICHEFERFCARMRNVKIGNFFGGIPVQQQKEQLKKEVPTIVVGTPGRVKQVRGRGAARAGSGTRHARRLHGARALAPPLLPCMPPPPHRACPLSHPPPSAAGQGGRAEPEDRQALHPR